MFDTLKAIQAQLTIQTKRMGRLAEKDELKSLTTKVNRLTTDVNDHGLEIEKIKTAQDTDRAMVQAKFDEIDQKLLDLSQREAALDRSTGSVAFSKSNFQKEKYDDLSVSGPCDLL